MKQKKYKGKSQKKTVSTPVNAKKKAEFLDFATRSKNQKALNLIAILLPTGIIASYYFSLAKYSINFPFFDDFEAILGFMRQYLTSTGIHEKIRLLWEQHSEHRLIFDRVMALAEYYFFGQVNFKSFILIGSGALFVTLILLYKSVLSKHKVPLLYLMPVAPVLFNFRYWETSFWPMAAMQNLWVPCFVLLSLYFLFNKNPYSIYLSALFGWIATYTSANGMMAFIAGAFVLIINKEFFNLKKILWFLTGGLAMASYFYHYVKPAYHPAILKPLMNNPLGFMQYAFAFLGGVLSEDLNTAIIAGVILVLGVIFISFKRYYKSNPVIYAFIIFILITSVLASLTRFGFGVMQALSSKYTISSALLIASVYAAFLSLSYRKMRVIYLVIIMTLALYFNFYTYTKDLLPKEAEKKEFDENCALVTQGKLANFNYGWPPLDERKGLPKRELKVSDSIGYFKFKFTEEGDLINNMPTDASKEVQYKIDRFEQVQANAILITGWGFIRKRDADSVMTVICFRNDKGILVKYLVCKKSSRPDITEANKNEANYDNSGFVTFFNPKELSSGKYTVTIFLVDSKYKVEINTGQQLAIQ